MYHEDGFKESMRLHKGPAFWLGWGRETGYISDCDKYVLYWIKFLHCSTYFVSSVLCVTKAPNYAASPPPKIV